MEHFISYIFGAYNKPGFQARHNVLHLLISIQGFVNQLFNNIYYKFHRNRITYIKYIMHYSKTTIKAAGVNLII